MDDLVRHALGQLRGVTARDVSQTDPELADQYDRAAPYWHHYKGIERHWRKRREAATAS